MTGVGEMTQAGGMIRVNGVAQAWVSALDRGLGYGDGVFRTLRLTVAGVSNWAEHYAALHDDAARLGLRCPAAEVWQADIAALAAAYGPGVVKCVLTRGCGARGYAWPQKAEETRIVGWSAAPQYPAAWYEHGVRARVCTLRLGLQPALAGIKHLNRLENVLARAEWQDPAIVEGIMLDAEGRVIEGVMSNLFWLAQGLWHTPALHRCGVAGVTRGRILRLLAQQGRPAAEVDASLDSLLAAEEAFMCNSLMGIVPLAVLDQQCWSDFSASARLRRALEEVSP